VLFCEDTYPRLKKPAYTGSLVSCAPVGFLVANWEWGGAIQVDARALVVNYIPYP
jgi:hypothetical protein